MWNIFKSVKGNKFQHDMIQEYHEVKNRVFKMEEAIANKEYMDSLGDEEREDIVAQHKAMKEYWTILRRRCIRNGYIH